MHFGGSKPQKIFLYGFDFNQCKSNFIKMHNAKYHWTTEALQFYYENSIKNVGLASIFTWLKSYWKFMGYYEEKN